MNARKAITKSLIPGAILLVIVIIAGLLGYRLNITGSMPLGVWKQADTIHRGAFVAVCIDESLPSVKLAFERAYIPRGECPNGHVPLLKEVGAVAGDTVTLTADAVLVNGKPLANSKTKAVDHLGRPMESIARGTYTVKPGEYWLFALSNPNSYDSRYFGAVRAESILHAMLPVATVQLPT